MGLGSEIQDPESGINLLWISDPGPGFKMAQDPGCGSATLPIGVIMLLIW
jgi:hypothetical protein